MERWKRKEDGKEIRTSRNRPHQVMLRLSDEELALFRELVAASGMSQQEYARHAVLGADIVNAQTVVDDEALRTVAKELTQQGKNLNQLVKKLHERNYIDYRGELPTMQRELKEAWQLLKQFLQTHP